MNKKKLQEYIDDERRILEEFDAIDKIYYPDNLLSCEQIALKYKLPTTTINYLKKSLGFSYLEEDTWLDILKRERLFEK